MKLQSRVAPTSSLPAAAVLVQRKCACGGAPGLDGECAACRKQRLQRRAAAPDTTLAARAPALGTVALHRPGHVLPAAARADMEARFGHDFGGVRVHTDGAAAASARAYNAFAYTVGQDIVFAAGRYNPATPDGRRLLAHELAHTVQQQGAGGGPIQLASAVDTPDAPLEREAEQAAEHIMAGNQPVIGGRVGRQRAQLQTASTQHKARRPMPDGYIEVTRTIEPQSCRQIPFSGSTPTGDLIYFDPQANAFGIRYRYCRGTGAIAVDSQLRYDKLRADAEKLLKNLPQTILGSGDIADQIRQTVRQTSVTASATVALTVSGTLQVELRGSTEQGLQSRSYEVGGLLRLTPSGWALELDAKYRHVTDQLSGRIETVSFTPRVNVGPVQAGVGIEHENRQPSSGTPASTTTVRGTVSVATGRGLGFSLSGSSAGGGTFSITFGTVDKSQSIPKAPRTECFTRDCAPPTVTYACLRVYAAHNVEVETQSPGQSVVQLHYGYDTAAPADPSIYQQKLDQIVGLVQNNYSVRKIDGFASPEASRAYNQRLSESRASQAAADIRARLAAATPPISAPLPTPTAKGELLGESETGRSPRNDRIIADISARLGTLSEAEQFALLGVDAAALDDAGRADLRERIQDFIQGKQGGRALATRPRWERIFPFLRRAEVELDRPRVTEQRPVPAHSVALGDCDADTRTWAVQHMPAPPHDLRLPQKPQFGF